MEKYTEILQSCALFEGITGTELMGLLHCLDGRVLEVKKEQPILREGEQATHLGIVLAGAVRLERQDYYGNRSIVAHIGPGQLFAESYACARVQALPISVVADEPTAVMLIDCQRITVSCCNACSFHSRIIHNLLYQFKSKTASLFIFTFDMQFTSQ